VNSAALIDSAARVGETLPTFPILHRNLIRVLVDGRTNLGRALYDTTSGCRHSLLRRIGCPAGRRVGSFFSCLLTGSVPLGSRGAAPFVVVVIHGLLYQNSSTYSISVRLQYFLALK